MQAASSLQRQRLLLLAPLAFLLAPFLASATLGFLSSFTDYAPAQAHVRTLGTRTYAVVLADDQSRRALRNIGEVVLVAVPAELAAGLGLAYALREPFRGRIAIRVLLLVPWLVSPVALGVMWRFLLSPIVGFPNFLLSWMRVAPQPSPLGLSGLALLVVILVDVWRKAPLAGFLLLPGLLAIPDALWEQATLDAASTSSRLRHIVIPSLRGLLLTVALLLVADSLGTFDTVLTMTGGGPGSETITPTLYSYQQAFIAHNWRVGVTLAWLVAGTVLLCGVVYLVLAGAGEGD